MGNALTAIVNGIAAGCLFGAVHSFLSGNTYWMRFLAWLFDRSQFLYKALDCSACFAWWCTLIAAGFLCWPNYLLIPTSAGAAYWVARLLKSYK